MSNPDSSDKFSASEEILAAQKDMVDTFGFFDDWTDRYQYIIDLGRQAEAFPEALKTDDNRLHGCQSQVWIVTERRGEKLHYAATSDSTIVAGLIAILLTVYSDRRPADILATPPAFIKDLQLAEHLSPTRSNGLHAMVQRVRQFALEAMVEDNQDYAGSPAW
jgi:cysteine desulfuration protein SufE